MHEQLQIIGVLQAQPSGKAVRRYVLKNIQQRLQKKAGYQRGGTALSKKHLRDLAYLS
jgi:hypothetical protein